MASHFTYSLILALYYPMDAVLDPPSECGLTIIGRYADCPNIVHATSDTELVRVIIFGDTRHQRGCAADMGKPVLR